MTEPIQQTPIPPTATPVAPQVSNGFATTPAAPQRANGFATTPVAPQGANSSPGAARTAVNPLAVLTLICGFIPFVGALALPLGRIALNQIQATGQRGRIAALIGITFGCLWLLDIFLVVLRMATTPH